jgi:hypothetical protein
MVQVIKPSRDKNESLDFGRKYLGTLLLVKLPDPFYFDIFQVFDLIQKKAIHGRLEGSSNLVCSKISQSEKVKFTSFSHS